MCVQIVALSRTINMKQHPSNSYGYCKCGGKLKSGVALASTYTGVPDFPGGDVVTLSPGGPGQIISVIKCERCGKSFTR